MSTEDRDQREAKAEPNSAGNTGGGAGLGATPCYALTLIREARDLLDGEIGDSDPIGSDWDVIDYPLVAAFQKLNQAELILQQNAEAQTSPPEPE